MHTVAYGPATDQVLDLHLPSRGDSLPVVVLLHGGFWYDRYRRDLMGPLVPSLRARGWAVANVEYRRTGRTGGGWPATFEDVAAAVDALGGDAVATVAGGRLDPGRVVLCGHSAGGQLAVWAAARHRLAVGVPGAQPAVRPRGAVALAGVLDLRDAHARQLGAGAVGRFLGDVTDERLSVTSPIELVPIGASVVVLHGGADRLVPLEQTDAYAARARAAGDDVRRVVLEGVDHFAWLDGSTAAWSAAVDAVASLLEDRGAGARTPA